MNSFFSFLRKYPKGAPYFWLVESAERFSYYGYRSIGNLFLISATAAAVFRMPKPFSEAEADAIMHQNIAITYLTPVLGGLVADWWIGKYRAIVLFGLICAFGHLLLGLSFHYESYAWLSTLFPDAVSVFLSGLFLIGLGAGGLKPNNTGLYGDSFQGEYQPRIEEGYRIFYACINIGSLFSYAIVPAVSEVSYEIAFQIPSIAMFASVGVLVLARKQFTHMPPLGGIPRKNFLSLNAEALWLKLKGQAQVWELLAQKHTRESVDTVLALWRAAGFFTFFAIVWSVYDLNGTQWVSDAQYLDRNLFGRVVTPGILQIMNPIAVITLVPLSALLFRWVKRRFNREIPFSTKIAVGMCFALAGTLMEAWIRSGIDGYLLLHPQLLDSAYAKAHPELHAPLSMGWQLLAYWILTSGEVLFSVAGLEIAYRFGPPKAKGAILAVWYLATSVGNVFVALITGNMKPGQSFSFLAGTVGEHTGVMTAHFYLFVAGILGVNLLAFLVYLKRVTLPRMYA